MPPYFFSFKRTFCSGITSITIFFEGFLNSVEVASFNPHAFLANSITDNCIPKHNPKNGILFFLQYSIAIIFPSIPLLPKPPGMIIPSNFFSSFKDSKFFSKFSDESQVIFAFLWKKKAACFTASITDM